MNFFQVFSEGGAVLCAVFLILLGMSFLSWYLIFLKSLKLRIEYKVYKRFYVLYSQRGDWSVKIGDENVEGSIGFLLKEFRSLQPILDKLKTKEDQKEIITTHLFHVLDEIRLGLDRGLTILASIGSSAPFIGLFGTVWGIYHALGSIALKGNAGLNVVAGPIAEALIATAVGLFAAIPAVLSYNGFVRLNRVLLQNLRHIAEKIAVYNSSNSSKN